ncbi:hypothetical protein DL764_010423 [Monosporascus ibericus]|uniref:UNC-45/Cro1/She4 central domain-containing protein n=1 Tax=Monosporascus ibericus TaxID=155417 RepID=A0A4Q4SRH8_9PEZI|nr:hypothetical protein DL764_010423 [Monosporascus ibericus]
MTPDEIERLFSSTPPSPTNPSRGDAGEEEDVVLSEGEKLRRTENLSQVLATVRQLWDAGSTDLDAVAENIGNAARDGSWRIPLGESQLLGFFIGIVGTEGLRRPLTVQALRGVHGAESAADQNRQRVIAADCLPKMVKLLRDDSLLPLVIPVLFNICVDYEPAHVAAYKAGLNPELVNLTLGSRLAKVEGLLSIICKLLGLVANQEPESDLAHLDTPFILLSLAARQESPLDLDDFLGQSTVALAYLAHSQFQDSFLKMPDAVPLFLRVLERASREFDDAASTDEELGAQLARARSVFVQVLADLSAHPAFAATCGNSLDGLEVQTLRGWLASPNAQLRSAACLALGNVARSDAVCVSLLAGTGDQGVQGPLVGILSDPASAADAQLLHAALGFLKNLAIPARNKEVLGDARLLDAPELLPRIWGLTAQPQVQFAAISLARLLLVNCPANVRRMIRARPRASPVADAGDRQSQTPLQALLSESATTDQEPTKTEAARAALTVCRVVHTHTASVFQAPDEAEESNSSPGSDSRLAEFYDNHAGQLEGALVFLGSQKKFPLLRSELWFVLALMARSTAARAAVVAGLLRNREVLEALTEAVTGRKDVLEGQEGQDSTASQPASDGGTSGGSGVSELGLEPQQVDPKQAASVAKVDRENGLVLIGELVEKAPDQPGSIPLDTLRRILKEGGTLVLANRDEA